MVLEYFPIVQGTDKFVGEGFHVFVAQSAPRAFVSLSDCQECPVRPDDGVVGVERREYRIVIRRSLIGGAPQNVRVVEKVLDRVASCRSFR